MTFIHEMLTVVPRRDDLIVAGDRRLSSDEVIAWAAEAAATLETGQPAAFQLPTGPEGVVAYRACWQAGAVAVPLLYSDEGRQQSHAFAALGTNRLLDPSQYPATGNASHRQITRAQPDDQALIMFTSGSTGVPKGVVHTQAALAYKTRQAIAIQGFTPADAGLFPASLAHVAGLLHAVLIPGAASIKTVLMSRWDPGEALRLIEHEEITYMVGPPTFFNDLMSQPDFNPSRTASLRFLSIGGASITPAFVNRARDTFGCVVKRAYGSTEAPTVTTCTIGDDPERMANTDGRPFAPTQIRLDEHGEIQVRGPEVTVGYLDPAHTAAAFTEDGWFRTGDLGRIDADGYLTVVGRLGQKIIRGGENIDAIEVEAILESHPAVTQAVALGEPDDRLGERVASFVVVDGAFDLDECHRWFAQSGAARFMVPERLVTVVEMPTMPSGKPDRSELARLLKDSTR
ncbi:class I adenylate-forming enzyme family protein [Candidatus Poriferisocius sp.]|uniref:class I adenylate-forming enzyme family protein n=1 Tax=Candidatus Poriferisocius sp. TaxID=3101276 RepID=UPI003B013E4F